MNDKALMAFGKEVATLLNLQSADGTGLYMTDWGLKTHLGLGKMVESLYTLHHDYNTTEFGLGPK
jgi:hypothetical protein